MHIPRHPHAKDEVEIKKNMFDVNLKQSVIHLDEIYIKPVFKYLIQTEYEGEIIIVATIGKRIPYLIPSAA